MDVDCVREVLVLPDRQVTESGARGGCHSASWTRTYGVPQGTVLSPMIFNSYMKPAGEVVKMIPNSQFTIKFPGDMRDPTSKQ